MARLSSEERAKLRAVADMIPDLPELRQAQKCKVAISVLFHVLRTWKPVWELHQTLLSPHFLLHLLP